MWRLAHADAPKAEGPGLATQEHHQTRPPSKALRLAGPGGPAVPLRTGDAAARAPRHHQRGAGGHVAIATGRVGR
eukprot:12159120-Alexandrium_andersonii.AAC.1